MTANFFEMEINMIKKTLTAAALAAGTMFVAATPAQAVITTFAQYQALPGQTANIYWKNNAADNSTGTGGSIYTTATNSSTVAGSRLVSFSFLQPSLAAFVTNVNASFTLNASVAATPALLAGGFLIQPGIAGSFSFLTTAPITVGNTFYATGSNLLSATFSQGAIVGQRNGTSGSFSATSEDPADTIVYTSDFLTFDPTSSLDFSLSLTSITGVLQAVPTNTTPTRALRSFRALSTGSFSSDPAPIVTAIPEPAVWGLMIVGFGMVGLQTRRRARNATVAA
ncbi:PEPxxWA-CTERM sorting domain-containing protein [Glacieibacterium frigidum]|uniref:PEP-CTERM protein-sorting domain-containing protein n=1 Tax=Glacieibacterium frigidum TaxID=2593303 RepID=A0A552UI59_9SPHN|nr:PEPxxWA-CTERM sorting domain-containing protein [Glacieibacterium frigidum]TRW17904.1 hypothetical protein FMM06_07190 [Glacieibacterium frigidum]